MTINDMLSEIERGFKDNNRRIVAIRMPNWMKTKLMQELSHHPAAAIPMKISLDGKVMEKDQWHGIPVQYGLDWEFAVLSEERNPR